MTRWHKADCATPDVVVDTTQAPHCRGCNAVAEIDHIIADHVAHHNPVEIPPDEPVGQMVLWWPPSVAYSSSHGSIIARQTEDEDIRESDDTPLGQTNPPTPSTKTPPSTYGNTLSAEEFRLARFDAPPNGAGSHHPIHLTLEVFRRDDCPEYETVSYTWGGEENDSTPCRPVFVGPYWDVLLQTRNCWNMLRYLRPSRGIRLVWIDAICINQGDPAERALQVANMRSVYQQCSRVIIYLGADFVDKQPTSDIPSRMHPLRHGLHEFDQVMGSRLVGQEAAMTLTDLLARRYFSRVWVIQEVLLSRAAIVPIAGREFWANSLTPIKYEDVRKLENPSRISKEWNWESTTVPWMRDLCAGSLNSSATLYDVLCRTWQSKATDPRDKLFGVLGLVKSGDPNLPVVAPQEWNGSVSPSITPDYTISVQHAFIGIMAHALLNLGITEVLMSASGLDAPPNHPSWMPDLYMSETQQADREGLRRLQPEILDRVTSKSYIPPNHMEESVLSLTYLSSKTPWDFTKFDRAQSAGAAAAASAANAAADLFNDNLCSEAKLGGSWNQRRVLLPRLYALHSWRAGAAVDPSTGGLLLKVAHILQFESFPLRMGNLPGNSLFGSGTPAIPYLVEAGSSSLFITVPETGPCLDRYVTKGNNHLFYLEREDTRDGPPEFLLLFLREVEGAEKAPRDDANNPREFKLLLCCPFKDIYLVYRKLTHSHESHRSTLDNCPITQVNLRHSLYATLFRVLDEIMKKSSDSDSPLRRSLSYGKYPEPEHWKHMFAGCDWPVPRLDDVLPLGQVILSSERSGAQDAEMERAFAGKYLACLDASFPLQDARLVSEMTTADNLPVACAWIEMTVPPTLVGREYWIKLDNPFGKPFHPLAVTDYSKLRAISWEWRRSASSGPNQTLPDTGNYGLWHSFDKSPYNKFRLKPGETITIRARVSEMVAFVKTTNMFKQMQRLHFMFRPPENSSERPPVKVKTWAGMEDETDMILRGPQEGDHFLPERPYRPWPEEIVRDFKADGEYWNIRIS